MATNEYDFVWWARDGASHLRQSGCREHADAIVVVCDRIRELEAELPVRDNAANEVLRILREATGKRDFHSEMEAAEWAAKMLAHARLDSARLKTALRAAMLVLSGQETSKSMLVRALELGQLAMKVPQ